MKLLATFKHISSKNADYGAAEAYLTFEHDEFTMKPTLDENGRLVPREGYRLATLNCGEEDFAVACLRSNLRYGKNQKREDVKSHHYIISFDPRDGTDNGLTVDKAQSLGEEFCNEHFPGHQAIVCTHPDGHNHSGNIHVHIVINSLRIEAVPLLPYMDRPADTKDGCKHRCTDAAMEYFKSEVMEMCHRENLYQIDLLHGSKNRVTEREYWAQKKGQLALDKENAAREATGQPTKPTKFETDKAKLRRTIRQALSQAGSFDEFSSLLLREGVTVKESRGRLSYLTPDRTKPITARKLGDDFDKANRGNFLSGRFTNKVNQFLFDGLSNYYTPSAGDPQNGCPLFLYPKIRKRRNAMPSKTEEYLALAQRTANGLTRYWESWTDYLTTASRLYKYPFADQLMIYAQRPDATACADYDIWNNRMNRYVRRGSKGIALLDESSGFPRLHYVFDVSDTGVRRNSRDPDLWQYNDDLKQPVSEMLAATYGISGERVSQQLADVAGKLVADYLLRKTP